MLWERGRSKEKGKEFATGPVHVADWLKALQLRGLDSAGMAAHDPETGKAEHYKKLGLVIQVFPDPSNLAFLSKQIVTGQVRYGTCGGAGVQNAQPFLGHSKKLGDFSVVHNGNLLDYSELRKELAAQGVKFSATSDTELIAKLIERDTSSEKMLDCLARVMQKLKGAFSLIIASREGVYAIRDPRGYRPLMMAQLPNGAIGFASESVVFRRYPEAQCEEVPRGCIRHVSPDLKVMTISYGNSKAAKFCSFEPEYICTPASVIPGSNITVAEYRIALGAKLAEKDTTPLDLVVPVLNSGLYYAIGYASTREIKRVEAIARLDETRSFIQRDHAARDGVVVAKHQFLPGLVKGKRIALVDDSLVRGTTMKRLVAAGFKAGAAEIHIRLGVPEITSPCLYGVDTPTLAELIVNHHVTEPELAEYLGATSVKFMTQCDRDNVRRKAGLDPDKFCDACTRGIYPDEPENTGRVPLLMAPM